MELDAVVDNLDNVPAEFHSLYTEKNGKFEITAIKGMKTDGDVQRIQQSLVKERNDHKKLKESVAPFLALGDVAEVQKKLDRVDELELLAEGKVDDAKIEKIVETRLASKLAPVQRELSIAKTQLTEKDGVIATFKQKEVSRTVGDAIRAAAKKANVLDSAVEDALLLGERVFEVNEDGTISAKDNVGVTPGIEPTVWFAEMQDKRPHWWGPTQGGGAGGSRGNTGLTANPWTDDNWNMTEQGKLYRENPTRATQLAKIAGTTIGGQRPVKRK